jgi:cytochrome P450
MDLRSYADVSAVLADPRFVPPPVAADQPAGTMGWLRAHVPRFSSGAEHGRRRALSVGQLAELSPAVLRRDAHARTTAVLGGEPIDLMARVARPLPVELLAGVPAELVAPVARAYQPGTGDGPDADAAVARLVAAFGGAADEATASRIGLLVQAFDATAGLIGNAAAAMLRGHLADPVEAILAETLRHDPPVRATSRLALSAARIGGIEVPAGAVIRLDLAAANRDPAVFADPDRFDPARPDAEAHLALGAGPRPCPGRDHAFAIAAGMLAAVRGCRLVEPEIEYEPSATLRVPARLLVRTG